jgi:hypothetical protein
MESAPHGMPPKELTLTAHRAAGASVWDRTGWDGSTELAATRWIAGVAAGVLAIEGLRRRGLAGGTLVGLGASLAWWASTGACGPSERWLASMLDRLPWRREDVVHEASADSFPASDAPSFTPTVGAGLRPKRRTH